MFLELDQSWKYRPDGRQHFVWLVMQKIIIYILFSIYIHFGHLVIKHNRDFNLQIDGVIQYQAAIGYMATKRNDKIFTMFLQSKEIILEIVLLLICKVQKSLYRMDIKYGYLHY